jgi:hypothetical protein
MFNPRNTRKPSDPLAMIFIFVITFGMVANFLVFINKPAYAVAQAPRETKMPEYLPTTYSDKHITENAILTDSRFKSIAFTRANDLLANSISSFSGNVEGFHQNKPENGTWLWTPILEITPDYANKIIQGAKNNGINSIYLSVDSYLDIYSMQNTIEKDQQRKLFDDILENFISSAHKNGIEVDAEAGWRNWAEDGNVYKPLAVIHHIIEFNKTAKEKFRGFQYDVEPYLLSSYEENKGVVLSNYLNLIDDTVTALDSTNLELSVVIPEFYDGEDNYTPKINYKGENGSTFDHLLRILDRRQNSNIIIMAYRNFSDGINGSIDIASTEVSKADNYNTKIIIAEESGEVNPSFVTFFQTSKSYYKKQMLNVEKAFFGNKSFGGIANHYINSYLELE